MESDGLSLVSLCRFQWTWKNIARNFFLKDLKYSYVTFTGSMIGIDSQVKLKMVLAIFPIRSKLDYIALLILQPTQIAKLLWKIWCHVSVFVKTLLSHIKRWCLAYRSDDLSLCNTNNGTESLNEDLKYG